MSRHELKLVSEAVEPELGKLGADTLAGRFDEFMAERFQGQPCPPETCLHLKYAYFAGAVEGAFNPRPALAEVVTYVEGLARDGRPDAMMLLPLGRKVQ